MHRTTVRYGIGLVLCVLMLYGPMWFPVINGPHLWLGLPSLIVWSSAWMVVCMVLLVRLERRLHNREDRERR